MRFRRISIRDFRNISSASIETDAEDIVLTGTNGQGKTNFLEAVYILCYGSSFRTSHLRQAVRHDEAGFSLSADFENEYGEMERISTSFSDGKRKIMLNGKEVSDRKELIYRFPCIAFVHDDIDFIKGEPDTRRRFFDQMMSLHSPVFFDDSRSYRMILMQRNAAIKGNPGLMHLYDGRLAALGLEIMSMRAAAVYDFNQIFPELFRRISGTGMDLEIRYQPSWSGMTSADEIEDYLASTEERDLKMLSTTSGIHRDRFSVMYGNIPFSSIGSTGQIRLCSLLFRISESLYFSKMTGRKPVILLDDVLLELDDTKRSMLLSELSGYSQAFYTFLPRERYFSDGKEADFISVNDGVFSRI